MHDSDGLMVIGSNHEEDSANHAHDYAGEEISKDHREHGNDERQELAPPLPIDRDIERWLRELVANEDKDCCKAGEWDEAQDPGKGDDRDKQQRAVDDGTHSG